MEKNSWHELADELQALLDFGSYKGTKVKVNVSGDGLDVKSVTNDKTTFYHVESVAVFCNKENENSQLTTGGSNSHSINFKQQWL